LNLKQKKMQIPIRSRNAATFAVYTQRVQSRVCKNQTAYH
jgi:hypothetical protein